ncbi:hypothetical protein BGX23_005262 [Mortierella sp. AD031]|nr:hypothetical protein BGX23_005262 [Mortierella sp. AD031]KAG0214897.1 hypothetical protein BGX33_001685 [Mortierella sp. NVP41]
MGDKILQTISAPIPVPGSRTEPTTPSLGSTTSTTIIHIAGPNSDLHKNSSSTGAARITTTIGTTSGGNSNNHHHINSSGNNYTKDNNNNSAGLRRFSSIGNTKKLHLENTTLRTKITELERYLQGLKEELILAHRQIHSKNLEAKISQERKAVEIHELGQHIQRCEFDLLAKTAECEALQNKLQYQTKDQMSKLKHINMLETEIMDYRRMSIMSGHGSIAGTGTGAGAGAVGSMLGGHGHGYGGVLAARGGSVLFRNSMNSSDLTESVPSSAVLQDSAAEEQIKMLKDENVKKDEQIQELMGRIQLLNKSVPQLETSAATATDTAATLAATIVAAVEDTTTLDRHDDLATESTLNASFNTATTSFVNSVGYDFSVEHPKLISRYQALRIQHAQTSEYLDQLESENQDLKVQLLDVPSASVSAVSNSVSTIPTSKTPEHSILTSTQPKSPKQVKQIQESTATIATTSSAMIATSNSRNSLHHPAASGLTPLDTATPATVEKSSDLNATLPGGGGESEPSPTSAVTVVAAPAPALTRKSSLRYSRDGQVSPATNVL